MLFHLENVWIDGEKYNTGKTRQVDSGFLTVGTRALFCIIFRVWQRGAGGFGFLRDLSWSKNLTPPPPSPPPKKKLYVFSLVTPNIHIPTHPCTLHMFFPHIFSFIFYLGICIPSYPPFALFLPFSSPCFHKYSRSKIYCIFGAPGGGGTCDFLCSGVLMLGISRGV